MASSRLIPFLAASKKKSCLVKGMRKPLCLSSLHSWSVPSFMAKGLWDRECKRCKLCPSSSWNRMPETLLTSLRFQGIIRNSRKKKKRKDNQTRVPVTLEPSRWNGPFSNLFLFSQCRSIQWAQVVSSKELAGIVFPFFLFSLFLCQPVIRNDLLKRELLAILPHGPSFINIIILDRQSITSLGWRT